MVSQSRSDVLKIIADYKVGLFIETGVNQGDLAAWMLARGFFVEDFHYIGITCDLSILDQKLEDLMKYAEQSFVAAGVCWSKAMLSRVSKTIRNSRKPVMVFCDGKDVEREFQEYYNILRTGDVVASYKFPVEFKLTNISKLENDGKIQRINGDFMKNTAIIAGVLI